VTFTIFDDKRVHHVHAFSKNHLHPGILFDAVKHKYIIFFRQRQLQKIGLVEASASDRKDVFSVQKPAIIYQRTPTSAEMMR
jgi:hypothetical protein